MWLGLAREQNNSNNQNPLGMLCLKTQGCIWQFFGTCLQIRQVISSKGLCQCTQLIEYIPLCLPKRIIQKFKLWPVQTQDIVKSSTSKKTNCQLT